ncbi:hypothetical protein [Isoptericola sp. NPDC055881]
MPARAVVLPATPLLVTGAGGTVDRLTVVRGVVDAALDRFLADALPADAGDGPLVVLAPVPRGAPARTASLRPSLAGAGIADRWVPAVAAWPPAPADAAHVPASVVLLALGAALGRAGARDVDVRVVEVAADGPDGDAAAALRGARGVVVAGGLAPGAPGAGAVTASPLVDPVVDPVVAAALDTAAAPDGWAWQVTRVPGGHEHLPAAYSVAEGVRTVRAVAAATPAGAVADAPVASPVVRE